MISFRSFKPQIDLAPSSHHLRNVEFPGLAVPTYIKFRAATATKSVYLCAYCDVPERVVSFIQRTVQQAGGISVCQPIQSEGFSQQRTFSSLANAQMSECPTCFCQRVKPKISINFLPAIDVS